MRTAVNEPHLPTRSQSIGIFDSGVGGLTVARHIMELMPHENTVYFGDTARVPYGSKSSETVIGYALEAVGFLEQSGVKMIVVACNTASAVALEKMRGASSVPVIGVIAPGAAAAVQLTRSGVIGVIGTEGTITSQAYQKAIAEDMPSARVIGRACPLFAPLAEEGMSHHPVTVMLAREYLAPLLAQSIDTLILGCTHYPILVPGISEVTGQQVLLADPGIATALEVKDVLASTDLLNTSDMLPLHQYYLSDFPHKFVEVGERFLGRKLEHVRRVTLEELSRFV